MNQKMIRAAFLLLIAGMFVYFAINLGTKEPVATVGEQAFDFELEDLDGNMVKLSDFKGQVVILNFFATWCKPCVDEAPELEAFEQEYGEQYKLLIIDIGETKERVQKFIDKHDTTSMYLFDFKREVYKKYGLVGQPETFVIDKDGVLREHYKGPLSKEELYDMVKPY